MSSEQKKTRSPMAKTAGSISHRERLQKRKPSASSLAENEADFQAIGYQLNGIYIVVAEIQSPGPERRYRRRFYANLPSAQRAVDRARQDGRRAQLLIGQVTIVSGGIDG